MPIVHECKVQYLHERLIYKNLEQFQKLRAVTFPNTGYQEREGKRE